MYFFFNLERIWATGKSRIRRRNVFGNIKKVKGLTEEELAKITKKDWQSAISKLKRVQMTLL